MLRRVLAILFLVALIAVPIIFLKGESGDKSKPIKPKVAATIFPLYDITRNIAGEALDVELILPPGASPHTFEPSPQEIKSLSGSRAVFSIGHGADSWAEKLAKTAGINTIIVVDKNVELSAANPHYWLSVQNAISVSDQVLEELNTMFPEQRDEFTLNHAQYIEQLKQLDEQIRVELSGKEVKIATFHNAWEYFAAEYGVDIVAVFEEYPGKEPSPTFLANFQKQIAASRTRVIFSEPQFSTAELVPIAADLGVEIAILDPLGGETGKESYINMMRYNVNSILQSTK